MHRFFARNTVSVSSVEFFWGLGIPVVIESTFLQLFLRNLGASSFLIGLIPTLLSLGLALIAPLSGALTAPLVRKRPAVLATHVAASAPMLALGIYLWAAGLGASTLQVVFTAYALFSAGVGMLWPVWNNYLVKIFVPSRAVTALAVMSSAQSAAKLLSSFFILKMVERYSFSATGAATIFTAVGLVFLLGSFFFLVSRETEATPPPGPAVTRASGLMAGFREVTANRNFLLFLGTELEYAALAGITAFYANYATEFCGVSAPVASGLFVGLIHLGGITANALLGWLGLLSLRNKYLVTKLLSLAAVPLLCFSCSLAGFLVASFCFGASRGTRVALLAPAVKRLSGKDDATHYFALAPLLMLPLTAGIPLSAGALIDRLSALGSWSYRSVFLGMGVLVVLGILLLLRVRFGEEPGQQGASAGPQRHPGRVRRPPRR
ncbi:MAG: MFS transporter [Spirochaetales bacterium]|nr:MFS transporter [Spirochaetales bacterium]